MRNHFSKLALTAALALAITLTLSCSSGDGGGGGGATCGGKAYDTCKYGCVNDELVGTCGGSYYNPENERCLNGEIQNGAEIIFPSSSSGNPSNGGSGKGHDIAKYKTKQIGDQVWMAEKLNYNVSGSVCYNNDPSNCAKYGRLYNWATAMALPSNCNTSSCVSQVSTKHRGICPNGWHIPSDDEWDTLTDFVGGKDIAGTKLKATSDWNENGNGEDTYGFSALPGGRGNPDGNFIDVGDRGNWWSAGESDSNAYDAFRRRIRYNYENVRLGDDSKDNLFSVRCLKD